MENPQSVPQKRLMDIKEAAEYLGVSTQTIRNSVYDGDLAFISVRARLLFDKADLEKFIESQRTMMTK